MLNPPSAPLKRILGTATTWLIGMGVAIGSGIFRTPGDVAADLRAPWLIVLAWLFGGAFVLMAGLVTAELATRFPRAGGEYVFLKEAYGEFVAFFFGWCYTVFILGGGAAIIALAFGDFGCELFNLTERWSGPLAAGAIIVVATINALGLRAGAGVQNALTLSKIAALLVIVVIGMAWGSRPVHFFAAPPQVTGWSLIKLFSAGVIPVLWAYDGTTDAAKMAEEIKDVRRSLPLALVGSAVTLMLLYVLVNLALMRIMPAAEMAGLKSVPGEAMSRLFGETGRRAMLAVAMLVFLSSLTSTLLAPVRVTFALARDGLAFRPLSRMSADQAPVGALVLVAVFAVIVVLNRRFRDALQIYFFASAILFGLAYASLIVFRLRDRAALSTRNHLGRTPPLCPNCNYNLTGLPQNRCPECGQTFDPAVLHEQHADREFFRCPAGPVLAGVLILIQIAIATGIVLNNPRDAWYTTALLAVVALLYGVWKLKRGQEP